MAKNYEVIHYIQRQLNGFDQTFVKAVIRCFCMIEQHHEYNGCMSNTAALFLIARKSGYDPEFCYGICEYENRMFYHAWLELDGMIIDPSIYGNISFGPMFDSCGIAAPVIERADKDLPVLYRKYEFDQDWKEMEKLKINTLCGNIDGKTLEQYMDGMPFSGMWKMTCRYLDATPSRKLIDELRGYCSGVIFDKYKGTY